MDAPTWRGAYDRWMILPQGRLNIIDLMNIVGMPDHFPEQRIWELAGASSDVWNMVTEGSTGFSSRIGQQVVLTAIPSTQSREPMSWRSRSKQPTAASRFKELRLT